jgi:hypothetical protein
VTIFVTGTCRENIVIAGFDNLALQASPIATIQDQANGSQPVVVIFNSNNVALVGFTINGGSSGVDCDLDSDCTIYLNRIQPAYDGVRFGSSHGLESAAIESCNRWPPIGRTSQRSLIGTKHKRDENHRRRGPKSRGQIRAPD